MFLFCVSDPGLQLHKHTWKDLILFSSKDGSCLLLLSYLETSPVPEHVMTLLQTLAIVYDFFVYGDKILNCSGHYVDIKGLLWEIIFLLVMCVCVCLCSKTNH